jgi:hypothetical protein
MPQDFFRRKSFACHDGCAYLAESYAMSPTGTVKDKSLNLSVYIMMCFHNECTAVKMTP